MSSAAMPNALTVRGALVRATLLALSLGVVALARAEERRAGVAAAPRDTSDVGAMFQATRELEAMGIRHLAAVSEAPVLAGGRPPARTPGSGPAVHRGRIIAPTLAFLHGLCDASGGLPKFGDSIAVEARSGGYLVFRATAVGQLLDADDQPSRVWIWDHAKIGARAQVRRVGGPQAR